MGNIKKILFVTSNDSVDWGGSEELWFQTAALCIKNKMQVAICVAWDPVPFHLKDLLKYENCTIIKKEVKAKFYNSAVPTKFKRYSYLYKNAIIDWNPELTVVSQGNNQDGLSLMEFLKSSGLNYVSIVQAVYEGIWPDYILANRLRDVYDFAKQVFFVSENNLKTTELMIGSQINKARIVRNPFNVPYENDLKFPDTKNGYKIACVARFELYAKGQDVLLHVLSQKKWKERNIFVNFYGSGKNLDNIHRLLDYFNLANVKVNPYTPTLTIWENNHALVLPSRFEGLPLALVEAMLCSRFAIVTNVSGNKEVLTDNITGFLAEAPKEEYLDSAMERAWSRRSEWEFIGKQARDEITKLIPENPIEIFYKIIHDLSNDANC